MQKEVNKFVKCNVCDSNAIGYYCDQNDIFKTYFCQLHEAEVFFNHLGKIASGDSDSIK